MKITIPANGTTKLTNDPNSLLEVMAIYKNKHLKNKQKKKKKKKLNQNLETLKMCIFASNVDQK